MMQSDRSDESRVPAEHYGDEEHRYERLRRTRAVLSAGLVVLFVLMIAVLAFVVRLASPTGRPSPSELPEGITWVRSIYGWGTAEDQQLYGPTDVAIGPDGTIWVADSQRFQIVGFTPSGALKAILNQGQGVIFPQSFDVSEDGELYVCDFAHDRIVVLSPSNKVLREWKVQLPMEVAVRRGRVVVGSRGGVAVYDTNGNVISYWGARGKGVDEFDVVRGLAIGEDGTIYLSDTQNRRLKAYDQKGTLKWVYPSPEEMERFRGGSEATSADAPRKPFQIPAGMTFDGAGRLLVVDPFEFAIVHVDTSNGHVVERWGEYGRQDGMFGYPTSIAYDPARDWFAVADTANDRVQIVRLPGSGGGALEAARRAWPAPLWMCVAPLALLFAAGVLAAISRSRRRKGRPIVTSSS